MWGYLWLLCPPLLCVLCCLSEAQQASTLGSLLDPTRNNAALDYAAAGSEEGEGERPQGFFEFEEFEELEEPHPSPSNQVQGSRKEKTGGAEEGQANLVPAASTAGASQGGVGAGLGASAPHLAQFGAPSGDATSSTPLAVPSPDDPEVAPSPTPSSSHPAAPPFTECGVWVAVAVAAAALLSPHTACAAYAAVLVAAVYRWSSARPSLASPAGALALQLYAALHLTLLYALQAPAVPAAAAGAMTSQLGLYCLSWATPAVQLVPQLLHLVGFWKEGSGFDQGVWGLGFRVAWSRSMEQGFCTCTPPPDMHTHMSAP